jgi:hypothetical protein
VSKVLILATKIWIVVSKVVVLAAKIAVLAAEVESLPGWIQAFGGKGEDKILEFPNKRHILRSSDASLSGLHGQTSHPEVKKLWQD